MKPRFLMVMLAGLLLAAVGAVLGDEDEHRGRGGPDGTGRQRPYAKEAALPLRLSARPAAGALLAKLMANSRPFRREARARDPGR
jgi:hypothetical protein